MYRGKTKKKLKKNWTGNDFLFEDGLNDLGLLSGGNDWSHETGTSL